VHSDGGDRGGRSGRTEPKSTAADGAAAGREKRAVALGSVVVGIVLTGLKLVVGVLTGSLGMLSEALHSALDLGAAVITFFSVKVAARPPDRDHHYGHAKAENLSALAEAVLLFATCGWVVWEAARRLAQGDIEVEATVWSFAVMGVSVVLDIYISRRLKAAARKHRSQALEADALHYSSDILSSTVVIAGLIGVRLGVPQLDPIAALGVAALVAVASLRLSLRAVAELMDIAPHGLADEIGQRVRAVAGVEQVESLRVRRSGGVTFVDMIVSARRGLALDQADDLTDRVEAAVRELAPGSDVVVHLHPAATGESIEDRVRAVARRFAAIGDVHEISCYRDGASGRLFLTLHANVAASSSLEEAHRVVDDLEAALREELPLLEQVETHIESADVEPRGRRLDLSPAMRETLERCVRHDPNVGGVHDIFMHELPAGRVVTCHLIVARDLSMEAAHEVATQAEKCIKEVLPDVRDVVVHTEPQ